MAIELLAMTPGPAMFLESNVEEHLEGAAPAEKGRAPWRGS